MRGKEQIQIVEVCPRDGFKSIKKFIPTEIKINIIKKLADSGISKIEIGSFVSPKSIPQMGDINEIVDIIVEQYPNIVFFALVPNFISVKRAIGAGIKEVSAVISLSETHNLANVKCTVNESLKEISKIRVSFPEL